MPVPIPVLTPTGPRPTRHYVFRLRQDRRRLAQKLASGMSEPRVAEIERVHEDDLRVLLADNGFRSLVGHYRNLAALAPEERLAALALVAIELLELAVEAGDVRAATFIIAELKAGRAPHVTLAHAAVASIRSLERTGPRAATWPPDDPPADAPGWRDDGDGADPAGAGDAPGVAPEPEPFVSTDPRIPSRFDAAHRAEEAGVAELLRVHDRLDATLRSLRRQVVAEAERRGTSIGTNSQTATRMWMLARHERPRPQRTAPVDPTGELAELRARARDRALGVLPRHLAPPPAAAPPVVERPAPARPPPPRHPPGATFTANQRFEV